MEIHTNAWLCSHLLLDTRRTFLVLKPRCEFEDVRVASRGLLRGKFNQCCFTGDIKHDRLLVFSLFTPLYFNTNPK